MSTGVGLNAQRQFPDTGGKATQDNTLAEQGNVEQKW